MALHKEKVHELVEIFYNQRKFKTFYVNSVDGKTFSMPSGVFVSLGITTPLRVLTEIKNVLKDQGFDSRLAEIRSDKVGGQYLNIVTSKTEEEISQYVIDENQYPEKTMNETEAKELLELLKAKVVTDSPIEVLREISPKVSKLSQIIENLDRSGWDRHLVQIDEDGGYKIFHTKVNYLKDSDTGSEYRIGIYVTEK
jgi:hypothetical protein